MLRALIDAIGAFRVPDPGAIAYRNCVASHLAMQARTVELVEERNAQLALHKARRALSPAEREFLEGAHAGRH